MNQKELYLLLKSTGLPVAYHHFKETTKPPFVVYYKLDSDNTAADNIVYAKRSNFIVELYTDSKDVELEAKFESLFDSAEIYYNSSEAYIESEEMYETAYSIQI